MIAGEKAPDFTLYDHTGRPRTLSDVAFRRPGCAVLLPISVLTDLHSPGLSFSEPERRICQVGRPTGGHQHRHRRQAGPLRPTALVRLSASLRRGRRGVRVVRGAPRQARQAKSIRRGARRDPAWSAHSAPWPAGPAAAGQTDHIRHRHRPHHSQGRRQRGARIGARRPGVVVPEEPRGAAQFAT